MQSGGAPKAAPRLPPRGHLETTQGRKSGPGAGHDREAGGVRTTNAPAPAPSFLQLRSWQAHGCLTKKRLAELLDTRGPCVGVLWVCPWYHLFDASVNPNMVYRACGRNAEYRRASKFFFRERAGRHAVVCFAYRCPQPRQMHVFILDNHSATGPTKWVDFEEMESVYTITVDRVDLRGRHMIVYPASVCPP